MRDIMLFRGQRLESIGFKPIQDYVNQMRNSKDSFGNKQTYRTALFMDIAYPGWEKNDSFWVKAKDLSKKRKFY